MTSRRPLRIDVVAEEAVLRAELDATGGLDVLSLEETDRGYLKVVLRQDCKEGCDACPHGPYVYHVEPEPNVDGGVHLHWTFISEAAD